MEEAVKKKETEDMLKRAREEQLKYKELSQAVEVAKNEAEFNRVLRYHEQLTALVERSFDALDDKIERSK